MPKMMWFFKEVGFFCNWQVQIKSALFPNRKVRMEAYLVFKRWQSRTLQP